MKKTDRQSKILCGHPAVKVLRKFFSEMNAWEWKMIRQDFSDLAEASEEEVEAEVAKRDAKLSQDLAKIFKKYSEAGLHSRRVTDTLHCGGEQPDYNAETERILSVEDRGDKVIVETQMAHNFKFQLRYELIKTNGTWRIRDNRKCKSDFSPRWSRWDL
jgi:hypothetical protein